MKKMILGLPCQLIGDFFNNLVDRDTVRQKALIRGLKDELARELPAGKNIIDESEVRRLYSRDLAEVPPLIEKLLFRTNPLLVVQPATEEDVVKILRFAQRHRLPVFPRGIASWGFGGATPTASGIVIDFSPMDGIYGIGGRGATIQVEAGARWGVIDQILEPEDLSLAVYPSNRFSTVAGWLSTGGFGLNSFKYGHVSNWIESIEVATPTDGLSVLHSGDDEFDLLFGAEGQLGMITKVTLKVVPRPSSFPHLLYCAAFSEAITFIKALIEEKCTPAHIKFMDRSLMRQFNQTWQKKSLSAVPDTAQAGGMTQERIVEEKPGLLLHFDEPAEREAFQQIKGQFPEMIEAPGYVANYLWLERYSPLKVQVLGPSLLASELVLPLDSAAPFMAKAKVIGKRYGVDLLFEAHLIKDGDESKVLMLTMFNCDRRKLLQYIVYLSLVPMITRLGIRSGGRPYGIGIWNVPFFASRFSPKRARRLLEFKRRVDPHNILNPRKFTAIRSRYGNIPAKIFQPLFFNTSMDLLLFLSPVIGQLLRPLGLGAIRKEAPWLEVISLECTNCGNCIAVCPAYQMTRHEGVVARSKLRLARRVVRGETVAERESNQAFLCTLCGACEEVCQTQLPLVEAWGELEKILEAQYGRPEEKIREFVDNLGGNPAYLKLIGSDPY
ncbi:MAG: FAD-binding protein [bacterium]